MRCDNFLGGVTVPGAANLTASQQQIAIHLLNLVFACIGSENEQLRLDSRLTPVALQCESSMPFVVDADTASTQPIQS